MYLLNYSFLSQENDKGLEIQMSIYVLFIISRNFVLLKTNYKPTSNIFCKDSANNI